LAQAHDLHRYQPKQCSKRYVAILNVHRRHLNWAQRARIVYVMFGEESKIEATKAKILGQSLGGKVKGHDVSLSTNLYSSSTDRNDNKWQAIAAQKGKEELGLDVAANAVKMMETVVRAPQTDAAVQRGEIIRPSDAHKKALNEAEIARHPAPRRCHGPTTLSASVRTRPARPAAHHQRPAASAAMTKPKEPAPRDPGPGWLRSRLGKTYPRPNVAPCGRPSCAICGEAPIKCEEMQPEPMEKER
jgi:hypothetical protein